MITTNTTNTADPWTLGAPRLLAGVGELGRVDAGHHRALHGPPALRDLEWLVRAADDVNMLGRGGAAFPVARKLQAMSGRSSVRVLANGSEGEPASHKDRTLMANAPHLVLDGALIVAHALGTEDVTIAVHDGQAHASLARAVRERPDAGGVSVVRTNGGFVAGEVRALINGLNGGAARPGGRRELPHVHGLGGRSTFASNVETFAQIALLAGLGVPEYARTGAPGEPGTSLVTLIGDVAAPGVVEVPHGTPLEVLLPGRGDAPVLVGGYHGTWVRAASALTLARGSLRESGAPWGAGVIARPFADTCVLAEVAGVSRWLADESVGQCAPCLFGLPALASDMQGFHDGTGSGDQTLLRLRQVRGRGACAHPDGAVQFMSSAIVALAEDIDVHRRHGGCGHPASTILPLPQPSVRRAR